MKNYPTINDINKKILVDETAHISYSAAGMEDIIHPYSISGYEYLSGGFVEFLDRFKAIIPKKTPIVLEISGNQFDRTEKETIDKAICMHYGLYLSEAALNLKKIRIKLILYIIFMLFSSSLLFAVSDISSEVVTNYAYVLFWFFGYRVFTHLILDYKPIYKEYQWYRKLYALKLVFADDPEQSLDTGEVFKETEKYAHEADSRIRKHVFVDRVLMEDEMISLGCRIEDTDDVIVSSGVEGMEIVSDEMAEYLMSAIPFIKQKAVTKLTIEGREFSKEEQGRISKAIRNYLAFSISDQEAERKTNARISTVFTIGLLLSTVLLFVCGKNVNLALHELILVSFWFFADYLLEFTILSRGEIRSLRKTLEKLAGMEIDYKP